jgi:hypothetical protein
MPSGIAFYYLYGAGGGPVDGSLENYWELESGTGIWEMEAGGSWEKE